MKPYYDEDGITIYHGDCREILPELTVDVVITDPPYGSGHYDTDTDVLTPELLRRLCEQPAAVFGYPELLVGWCVAAGLTPDEWITWWASNAAIKGFNLSGLWKEAECVAVFGRHRMGELRRPRTASSRRVLDSHYGDGTNKRVPSYGVAEERRQGDVWTDAAPGLAFQSHQRLHPNEKPLSVMRRLVEGLSQPAATVLDPFMGSGTTLRAAADLGRRAIGVEVDERHCEVAAKRLAQGVLDFGAA